MVQRKIESQAQLITAAIIPQFSQNLLLALSLEKVHDVKYYFNLSSTH